MKKFFTSPIARIAFGLTTLMLSLLFSAQFLGLLPDTRVAEIKSRKVLIESLAVQLSTNLASQQLTTVKQTLRSVVERNPSILSGAVRMHTGSLLAEYGNHNQYWTLKRQDKSTANQVQVSIFNHQGRWGSLELRFDEIGGISDFSSFRQSYPAVVLFVSIFGFLAFWAFLKRVMKELDPDAVVPDHVRHALDTLAEGLLIIDDEGCIVFANSAFAEKTGLTPKQLVGKDSDGLGWELDTDTDAPNKLPWTRVLNGKEIRNGIKVKLHTELGTSYTFAVNVSAITPSPDVVQGALVTFDDITEIEAKNEELNRTLGELEHTQREVTRQNEELMVLATRDPLTNLMNRRAFFQGFESLFAQAQKERDELSFIMLDIDHFKLVNDNYGHGVGDEVIKLLAHILGEYSRPHDLIGRFGGEEFCVVLPKTDINAAAVIADRLRVAIEEHSKEAPELPLVTSSFGLSTLRASTSNGNELVAEADKALYVSKENGRNLVTCWTEALESAAVEKSLFHTLEEPAPGQPEAPGHAEKEPVVIPLLEPALLPKSKSERKEVSRQDSKVISLFPDNEQLEDLNIQRMQAKNTELRVSDDTGLSNPTKTILLDRIGQAINRAKRYDTNIAMLVIDIDTLQLVNDTLGLLSGEEFLNTIIEGLQQTLRTTDTVSLNKQNEILYSISPLGSSEIIVMLTDLHEIDPVAAIIQRIFSAHEKHVSIEGHDFYLNTNIGVSLFPLDGDDPITLIKNASSAKRLALESVGRSNFCYYAQDLETQLKKEVRLEADLHRALKSEELVSYYQPIISLRTGNLLGMETLIRWQHPQLGIVMPNDFIPLAEKNGMIVDIDRWVIRETCKYIRSTIDSGAGPTNVAVNLSPVALLSPGFENEILALVDEFGIPPNSLELEITETVIMHNIDTTARILDKLHAAGLNISLDDFGTGYSSLSYLKRFPLHKVKIDRSFVSDTEHSSNNAAIVEAIIAMSHSLGLQVIAEGVETEEQLRFLQDLHCDAMQGSLFSWPVPAEETSRFMAKLPTFRHFVMEYGVNYDERKKEPYA